LSSRLVPDHSWDLLVVSLQFLSSHLVPDHSWDLLVVSLQFLSSRLVPDHSWDLLVHSLCAVFVFCLGTKSFFTIKWLHHDAVAMNPLLVLVSFMPLKCISCLMYPLWQFLMTMSPAGNPICPYTDQLKMCSPTPVHCQNHHLVMFCMLANLHSAACLAWLVVLEICMNTVDTVAK
jgi:hypothetical protein